MEKLIEAIIIKYEGYIENIEWHINTNNPVGADLEKSQLRILDFRAFINDLTKLII